MAVDKKNLSKRLEQVGLKKADLFKQNTSIERLSSFYLSRAEARNHHLEKYIAHVNTQEKIQAERIASKAVEILGKAIKGRGRG